jgi:hypothetical protein
MLEDQMSAAQTAAVLEEAPEQRRGDAKRRVGYDVKRPAGKTEIARVGLDDEDAVTEAVPEGASALGVSFHGNNAGPGGPKFRCDGAISGAYIDDERLRREGCVRDELGGPARFELVPSPRRGQAVHGDGP